MKCYTVNHLLVPASLVRGILYVLLATCWLLAYYDSSGRYICEADSSKGGGGASRVRERVERRVSPFWVKSLVILNMSKEIVMMSNY